MSISAALSTLRSVLAASLLVACAAQRGDDRVACDDADQLAAYDLAYDWSEQGACEGEECKTGSASALWQVESPKAASCALAGARAGLLSQRRGGRERARDRDGREHGQRGHHGRGHGGNEHDGRGHHGSGHHDGRGHGGECRQDEVRECRDDGRFTGQVTATTYCELSIAFGGLGVDDLLVPGPESRCSRAFEEACGKAFDEVAQNYQKVSGDPSADCTPFTTGEFREAYEVARFNQCLFSLAEAGDAP